MPLLFLDSSAIYAAVNKDDPFNQQFAHYLQQTHYHLLITNLILAETISLITKRKSKNKGIEVGTNLLKSTVIEIEYITKDIQNDAFSLYKKYQDKDFDLVDATSFIVCKKRDIQEVLTLDKHFNQMGFKTVP